MSFAPYVSLEPYQIVRGPDGPLVAVPKTDLKLLYGCAKEYDVRIPREAHYDWAIPFIEMFEESAA